MYSLFYWFLKCPQRYWLEAEKAKGIYPHLCEHIPFIFRKVINLF